MEDGAVMKTNEIADLSNRVKALEFDVERLQRAKVAPDAHRAEAERLLAESAALFEQWLAGGRDDQMYNHIAHLRQTAAVHALLSRDRSS
jgi:hypothetical protein